MHRWPIFCQCSLLTGVVVGDGNLDVEDVPRFYSHGLLVVPK